MNEKPDDRHDNAGDDEESVDEPVLAGSEDHSEDDIDPRKGLSDPALIRDIKDAKKTVNPYG
jgi:hypothetical protein